MIHGPNRNRPNGLESMQAVMVRDYTNIFAAFWRLPSGKNVTAYGAAQRPAVGGGARLPTDQDVSPEKIDAHQLLDTVKSINAPSRGPSLHYGSARF